MPVFILTTNRGTFTENAPTVIQAFAQLEQQLLADESDYDRNKRGDVRIVNLLNATLLNPTAQEDSHE